MEIGGTEKKNPPKLVIPTWGDATRNRSMTEDGFILPLRSLKRNKKGGCNGLEIQYRFEGFLHPELVKTGVSPESATAILDGEPLQGFECESKGIAYPTIAQLQREGSPNPEAERKYMLLQIEKSIDGGRSFPQGWRPWEVAPDNHAANADKCEGEP